MQQKKSITNNCAFITTAQNASVLLTTPMRLLAKTSSLGARTTAIWIVDVSNVSTERARVGKKSSTSNSSIMEFYS